MPDVGVLQLSIRDNSETAAGGLTQLSGALRAVKDACRGGFNLSNGEKSIAAQVKNLADTVKSNSTVIRNLGTLFNALTNFSKLKDVTVNTQPIEDLKTALDGGLNIGKAGTEINKLREAITGDWGDASQSHAVSASLTGIATAAERLTATDAANTIKNVAKSIKEYSSAIGQIAGGGAHDLYSMMSTGPAGTGNSSGRMKLNLQFHAGNTVKEIDSVKDSMEGLLQKTTETIQFSNNLSNYVDTPLDHLRNRFMAVDNAAQTARDATSSVIPALREYRDAALAVESKQDLAGFSRKTADDFISTLKETEQETKQISEQINEDISSVLGTGSIQPIYEDPRFGPILAGLQGVEAQLQMMKSISSGTGLGLDEIMRQLTELSHGAITFGNSMETAASSVQTASQTAVQSINRVKDEVSSTASQSAVRKVVPIDQFIEAYSHADYLKNKIEELKAELSMRQRFGLLDKDELDDAVMRIRKLTEEYKKAIAAQNEASVSTKLFSFSFKDLNKSLKTAFPLISRIGKQIRNIVIRRTITAAIRAITSGIKEGVQNVYEYSKAVKGSFAPSMDSAASSIATMKNALGAAFAPLIQSLIPVLQTIVNGFINLLNYANQFFALLRGQSSWLRAVPQTTTAFNKQEKAAKSAGSAIKDLLADWDELNIIQSNTSGSGSGAGTSSAEDYLNMFEEVGEFDNKVRDIVDFVKDNFVDILGTVIAIKGGIAAWKFGAAFAKSLPFLATIAQGISLGATIGLSIIVTDLLGKAYIDNGSPAYLVADALTGAVGAALAGKIATKIAGGMVGGITAGFTLTLEGIVNIKNAITAMEQQKDAKAWALGILGDIEIGIGAAVIAKSLGASAAGILTAGLGAAVAAAVFTIPVLLYVKKKAEYKQMAIDAFKVSGENGISVEDYIAALQTRLDELTAESSLTVQAFVGFEDKSKMLEDNYRSLKRMNTLLTSKDALTPEQAKTFKETWHTVFEALDELSTITWDTIYSGLNETIANGSETLRKEAEELRRQVIEIAGIVNGTRGRIEKEMELLMNTMTTPGISDEEFNKAAARYEELYKLIANTEYSGMKDLKKRFAGGEKFDFSDTDKPVDAAVAFIKQISEEDIQPALDEVKAAYDAQMESIEYEIQMLGISKEYGDITDEQYQAAIETMNRLKALTTKRYEEQVGEIEALRTDAYEAVIRQAFAAKRNLGDDATAKRIYDETVIEPILKAAEEAGHDVSMWREALIPFDFSKLTEIDTGGKTKDEVYNELLDLYMPDSDEKTVEMLIWYEIDTRVKNKNTEGLEYGVNGWSIPQGSDLAKEMINSILHVDGISYANAIEEIAKQTGWDMGYILDQVDLSQFDFDQLEMLLEDIEMLKSEYEFNNPITEETLSDVADTTNKTAQYYEDMANRIKEAMASVDEATAEFSGGGGGGSRTVSLAGMMSGIPTPTIARMLSSTGAGTAESDAQMQTNIQSGTEKGTASLLDVMRDLLAVTQAINRKDFTVTITPTSGLGFTSRKANELANRITGG